MAKEMTRMQQNAITIGSCDVYIQKYEGGDTLPSDPREVCKGENHLAHTKGGCQVVLSKETKTFKDDFERISKTIIISTDLKVKLGLLAWNGDTLAKIEASAETSIDEATGLRCTKLGGKSFDDGAIYLVVLHHIDAVDGDCWWMFTGKNTAGIDITYDPENESKVEPEFAGEVLPDGHLIYFYEQVKEATAG